VGEHQGLAEAALGTRALVVGGAPLGDSPVSRDRRAGALRYRAREARVVEVVMREEEQLDVRQAAAVGGEAGFERVKRLVVGWARIDERERLSFQQPEVDRAEVRDRDRYLGNDAHGRD
jgi:hypothetical protein